jgi:valyl-tRNA synthetase
VTPAHDPNDFATGKRHQLEELNILDLDGTLNEAGGPFQGMERFAARKAVKKALEERGLARGTKKHIMTLPRSQRSGTIVEPLISTQWFVRMQPLAAPAIACVEDGRVQIIPEDWNKTYFHWMRNIQDWCISRQLWWGHHIPAWYCGCGEIIVSRTDPTACPKCGSEAIERDPDVLDTWFSSALWPFSTLGWPDETDDLARFYPTDDMETGYDILFFWVARMIMMGLHFMDEVPFRRVLLSGMVTDERGEKMSKVKGNVIDPIDVIEGATLDALLAKAEQSGAKKSGLDYLKKTYPDGFAAYGADALRMTLLSYSPQTRRIALSIKRIEGYRNFANKLWNASRFALMNLEGRDVRAGGSRPTPRALVNRWILSRLHVALSDSGRGLEEYRFDDASKALYRFVWDDLCDWYLELTKPLFGGDDAEVVAETAETLVHVFDVTLRALHPMMPFITEEIWQRVPKTTAAPASIVLAPYPVADADAQLDAEAERELTVLMAVITAARTIRAEHDVPRATEVPVILRTNDATVRALLEREATAIRSLCRADLSFAPDTEPVPPRTAISVAEGVRVLVPLEGLVDLDKERERLQRELQRVEKDLGAVEKKLSNEGFLSRAPADVVATERERRVALTDKRDKLRGAVAQLP